MLYVHTENGASCTSYRNAAPALRLTHVHSGDIYHPLCVLPLFMSMPQSPWMPAHPQREAAMGSCGLVGLEGNRRGGKADKSNGPLPTAAPDAKVAVFGMFGRAPTSAAFYVKQI